MLKSAIDVSGPGDLVNEPYLNLFGKVDENKENEKKYQEALAKYPLDTKVSNCDQVESMVKNINLEIETFNQEKITSMASGGSGRPQNRQIIGYTKRKNEIESVYNNLKCAEQKEAAATKEFHDTQFQQLEKVTSLTSDKGNATMWVIYGMLGIVVITAGVLIIRKLRKAK